MKPGRPPDKVKRMALSLRVTPAVRKELDIIVAITGRSLSHEAEILLESAIKRMKGKEL